MSEYYDTFFMNPKRALKIAKEKNKVHLYNGWGDQICYYSGEVIQNTPANMIHLPLEDVKGFFSQNSYRLPEYIDFNKSSYEDNDELQIKYKNIILNIFKDLEASENIKNTALLKKLKEDKKVKLDSNNINFVILVSRTLKYDFFYAKQLKKALKALGHTVTILTEDGSKKVLVTHLKTGFIFNQLIDIKPNAVIFINDYKPDIITEDKFQISILNGFISLLNNIKKENIRKKDIILSQNQHIETILNNKDIPLNYIPPVINIKKDKTVYTKKDILTIYSNYFDLNNYILFQTMVKKLLKSINQKTLNLSVIKASLIKNKYENKNDYEMMMYLQKNITLQSCIQWIEPENITLNIVGKNWDNYKKLPSTVAVKESKKPLKAYRNSKYVLHISSNIIDINLLEILNSGAIPIIYDLREEDKNYNNAFDDYCLFFKNKKELNTILNQKAEPLKRDYKNILKDYSFKALSKKIESFILNYNEH